MTEGSGEGPNCVPGAEQATADPRKFTAYLLSETHTVGRAKARFFRDEAGYDESNWKDLRDTLLAQLPETEAEVSRENPRGGVNYVAPMTVTGPAGTVEIQTVWEVHPNTGTTFVTAHPL